LIEIVLLGLASNEFYAELVSINIKAYCTILLLLTSLSAEASPDIAPVRATFGLEYLTPGTSQDHDYNATMISLGSEFKLTNNINLVAASGFQEEGIPKGVEFKYDLLLKYNRFRHQFADVSLLMGYTNSTIAYQACNERYPQYCRTYKKDDTGAIYGASIDMRISGNTVVIISAMKGGQLDITRLSVLLTRPF